MPHPLQIPLPAPPVPLSPPAPQKLSELQGWSRVAARRGVSGCDCPPHHTRAISGVGAGTLQRGSHPTLLPLQRRCHSTSPGSPALLPGHPTIPEDKLLPVTLLVTTTLPAPQRNVSPSHLPALGGRGRDRVGARTTGQTREAPASLLRSIHSLFSLNRVPRPSACPPLCLAGENLCHLLLLR